MVICLQSKYAGNENRIQLEREKLEQAKKIVYKKGFYTGIMNSIV